MTPILASEVTSLSSLFHVENSEQRVRKWQARSYPFRPTASRLTRRLRRAGMRLTRRS